MSYRNYKKAAPASQKAKRWYVDASIPKGIPFVGGSSFRAGSGTLTKRSLTNLIRATGETKQKIVGNGITTAMTQNTLYSFNPLGNITIGTGANSRLGASIFVKRWIFTCVLSNNGATSTLDSTLMRFIVVKLDGDYLSGSDVLGAGVGATDIFVTNSSQMINSHIDNNKCSVLYDKVHLLDSSGSLGIAEKSISFEVCKDKMFKYQTPSSNYSALGNYYLVAVPYATGKTSGVTPIADIRFESLVDFADA